MQQPVSDTGYELYTFQVTLIIMLYKPDRIQSYFSLLTQDIICYLKSLSIKFLRKEGNVLFNDALNTFYLRLYGIRHMVRTIQIARGNPLLPHRLLFPINSKGSYICTRKEGNILFNDALNTFYLWLYGIRHMVKDHFRGNLLPPHRLLFPISSNGSFICTIPQTG